MIYTPRLTRPTSKDKYYITKAKGGYSNAIEGKCKKTGKPDTQCNTLSNCVGYAHGRFHEIIGDTTMKYLLPTNAENFPEYAKSCKQGNTPKLGSVIVWQKGSTLKGGDGAGHVAIVESIISDTQILISQSGWNSEPFWTEKVTLKNGQWKCSWMGSDYKFRCFIYNPSIPDNIKPVLSKGSVGIHVKEMQKRLNDLYHYGLVVDGSFGDATLKAVKDFQTRTKLKVDGYFGEASWKMLETQEAVDKKPAGVIDLATKVGTVIKYPWVTEIEGEYYIRLDDFVDLGLAKTAKYNKTSKQIEITK